MKKLLLITMLLAFQARAIGGPDTLISCQFHQAPFDEFCDYIFQQSGVKVYYLASWTKPIRVTVDTANITPITAVQIALEGTGLAVSPWHGSLVVMPSPLPLQLPVLVPEELLGDSLPSDNPSLTESEQRYLTGRKPDVLQTLTVGKKGGAVQSDRVTIRGRITEQQTGEPVIGATMYIEETGGGTATDQNGFLSLVIKPGSYNVVFAYLGLETRKYLLEVHSEGEFSIEMNKSVIQMKEVEVFGDRQMNLRLKDPGLEKISAKSIKEIPMLLGERDILHVSEMLPGIVTVGEGSAGLTVRGGNYDQNAFFINRIPVYNTSHLFGFFPAFNADVIKDFSIYKGHMPAQYGGRLSSVFNIIARQGNRKEFTARGGISPVTASLCVEGPLKKDTSSFLVSGRYLYSDWILRQIEDPVIRSSRAGFNDISLAWNYDFSKSQLSVFGYHSQDRVELSDLSTYRYSNNGVSVSLSHHFSNALRAQFYLTGMQYAFNTIDKPDETTAYEHGYLLGDYRFGTDFTQVLSSKNSLEYGLAFTLYRLDRGEVEPYGQASLRLPVELGREQGLESALYLADTWDILPWLNLYAGGRLTLFNPLGPQTVYEYTPGLPKDPRYVTDSISYSPGQAIKWYLQPDIRLAANIRTDADGTVKVSFNRSHQNLFMLNNTIALSPNSQWKLADYHIQPARSSQVSAGVFRTFPGLGWEASAEVFYKHTTNLPEFTDGANFISNPDVETTVLPGEQKAYGIELLLRRSGRKFEGWIAYTWSRSIMQVTGSNEWEQINNGKAYPANYDIPHVVNAVFNYHFSRRVTFSTVLAYQTGRPVTYPTSIYYINGVEYVDYSDRNAYRIPDYFRIDASLTIEGNLRRNKFLHSSFIIGVYNLTGRENPYSVYFTSEGGEIKSYQYSVIGVPLLTVTWLFKLGNYATD